MFMQEHGKQAEIVLNSIFWCQDIEVQTAQFLAWELTPGSV